MKLQPAEFELNLPDLQLEYDCIAFVMPTVLAVVITHTISILSVYYN